MQKITAAILAFSIGLISFSTAHSKDLSVGQKAPEFVLTDINGQVHSLSDYKGKYVVLEWVNHGCPFVKKHYNSQNMQDLQKEITQKGVIWLSICSSAQGKQGYYSASQWKNLIKEKGMQSSAVLLDEPGTIGKLYGAKTTPHMFVINPQGNLIYQGAIDDRPSTDEEDIAGAKNYVRTALDQAMAGKKIEIPQTRSYGCSVKYK